MGNLGKLIRRFFFCFRKFFPFCWDFCFEEKQRTILLVTFQCTRGNCGLCLRLERPELSRVLHSRYITTPLYYLWRQQLKESRRWKSCDGAGGPHRDTRRAERFSTIFSLSGLFSRSVDQLDHNFAIIRKSLFILQIYILLKSVGSITHAMDLGHFLLCLFPCLLNFFFNLFLFFLFLFFGHWAWTSWGKRNSNSSSIVPSLSRFINIHYCPFSEAEDLLGRVWKKNSQAPRPGRS